MKRIEPIEWFGILTTLAAVVVATREETPLRGSRAPGPSNPCKRLANHYREEGDADAADDFDLLSESPSPSVLDQCAYELGMTQGGGRTSTVSTKRRPGLARR